MLVGNSGKNVRQEDMPVNILHISGDDSKVQRKQHLHLFSHGAHHWSPPSVANRAHVGPNCFNTFPPVMTDPPWDNSFAVRGRSYTSSSRNLYANLKSAFLRFILSVVILLASILGRKNTTQTHF